MPTLAVGPVSVGDIVLSDTDTVVAIPIFAAGAVLPMGLASFGTVITPGVVFPTATGVSTLGGTSLTSFSVPLLGLSLTNTNILSATYIGTNGVNYNSGQSVALLTTPIGALPIVYSLGSYNVGTTGFGFTLPSLFGIGLLPPFQVGTAPTQQSPDGLIPASVLNLGLATPTQVTDLVTLLGLPNPGALVTPILNPAFNTAVAPVGSQITNALNSSVGPLANGLASAAEQLTALLAQLSGAAQAIAPTSTASSTPSNNVVGSAPGLPGVTSVPDPSARTLNLPVNPVQSQPTETGIEQPIVDASAPTQQPDKPPTAPRTGPRLNVLTHTGNPATTVIENRSQARPGLTNAPNQPRTTVTNVTKPLTDVLRGVTKRVTSLGSRGDDGADQSGEAAPGGSSTP